MCHNLQSSIGKKIVMAVTGLILMLFVIGHLIGNLQIFLGPEWINAYAKHLQDWPIVLWSVRIVLITTLIVHMTTGIFLAAENRRARPVAYEAKATIQATIPSRTMVFSGLSIFFFILFHLAHFTFGRIHPEYFHALDAKGRHDVYSMVVHSFQHADTVIFYVLAMFFLSMHLSHGLASFPQTLGWLDEKKLPLAKQAGVIVGVLIFLGYSSIALASLSGWLQPLAGGMVYGA